jgi:hypothetical protein
MQDTKELFVGDKITVRSYGAIDSILSVVRVTSKRAYAVKSGSDYEYPFEREFTNAEFLKSIGGGSYPPKYSITKQSDYDEIELSQLREQVAKLNGNKLTADQCRRILEIVKEVKV